MEIIIVGCGKVGYTLATQLSNEDHNIVVVDKNPDKVEHITSDLDAMGVVGNGVSYQTLQEAGVSSADLVIAVTGSDEENLLCCVIAKKAGNCKTIARVRNPIYNEEIETKKAFSRCFLLSKDCVSNEIYLHLQGYLWALEKKGATCPIVFTGYWHLIQKRKKYTIHF